MDCVTSTDPLIQVEEFDEDTFILRLSKCFSYEGNFMYLLFGNTQAILFDTGAPPDAHNLGAILPIRKTVDLIVSTWLEDRRPVRFELIVAHTHGHRDHAFWDNQFEGRKNTTIVRPTLPQVKSFFGLLDWPEGQSTLNLGGRMLIVFPLPGHETSHIAVYDERTRVILTGDTLYPGLLTVEDWTAYRRSAMRLCNVCKAT